MNILLVEDERYILEEIVSYITEYDQAIHCIAYENPIEALEKEILDKIDIAFLDIEMPRMNGLELAGKISNINPEVKVVFITAYNNYAAEAFEVNAVDYLLKPLRKERLYNTLEKLMTGYNKQIEACDITIKTFGKLVVSNGDCILKWKRQKAAEVFAFLLLNKDKAVHKDILCDTLWPDYEPAKALVNLQTVMYQLRKSLSETCKEEIYIEYTNNSYQLMLGKYQMDRDDFEENYLKAFESKNIKQEFLLNAYHIYKAGYLEEEGWLWALAMQQNLELKYKRILEQLITLNEKRKDYNKLIEYLEKISKIICDDEFEKYFLKISEVLGIEKALKWKETLS